MATPIFSTTLESLQVPLGLPFAWFRGAPGATAWAASNLPDGVSIDAITGVISGTPTVDSTFSVAVTPSNGDGAGAPLLLMLTVAPLSSTVETIGVMVDFDLDTGKVTRPGQADGSPVLFWGKTGDRIPVLVGFTRGGVLRDVTPSSIAIGVKEFEAETLWTLTADPTDFLKLGFGSSTRYLVIVTLTAAALRSLTGDYEGDVSSGLDMVAEIEVTVPEVVESSSAPVAAVESFTLDHASNVSYNSHVWQFLLPVSEAGWYDLEVSTVTAGLPAVEFTVQVLLAYGPGGLTVSAVDGAVSAAGSDGSIHLICYQSESDSIDYAAGNLRVGLLSYYTYYPSGSDPTNVAVVSTATLTAVEADPYDNPEWKRTSQNFLVRMERDLQP